MKFLSLLAMAATFAAAGFHCAELSAQQTSTGAFGSRTTGGTGGVTAPRGGGSSSGSSGMSSIGAGSGGSLLQDVQGTAETGARYTRNARSQGNQFVGTGSEDARAVGVVQAASAGGNNRSRNGGAQQFSALFNGQNGNLLGQFMQQGVNQGNQRQRSTGQLRIPIRMGLESRPIATSRFTGQFQTRLGKLPALTMVGPIEVQVEGETVVLRGTVASEGDRQLVEDLARLEPDVSQVRNELTIQVAAESGSEVPPAPTSATP